MISAVKNKKVERRGEVDLMRALMVFGLILFHTARIFDQLPFNIKNDNLSLVFTALVGFVSQWGMPLFFLIAGIATWHALQKRPAGKHVLERTRRLVIPFIFGMLVIVPPLHYYTWRHNSGAYHDSYWQFYSDFIAGILRSDFPWMVRDTAHMWFLYYLFIFSMLMLPLFVYLKRSTGRRLVSRLAAFCRRPGAIFLLAVPIVLIETLVVIEHSGGWNRFAYILLLIYGYLIAADSRFERTMYRNRKTAVVGGALSIAAFFLVSILLWKSGTDPSRGWTWESIAWRFLKGCCSWFWIVAILGWAHGYMSHLKPSKREGAKLGNENLRWQIHRSEAGLRRHSLLEKVKEYANEAVLPFYVIHQTVIVVIGFYVVKWGINLYAKYLIIVVATFGVTLSIYEVVRRTNLTRFLFGMKVLKSDSQSGGNEGLRARLSTDIRRVSGV